MELPYTAQQLNQKKVIADIDKQVARIVEENDVVDAYYLADILRQSIKSVKLSKQVEKHYREIISQLQILSLYRWPTQTATALFTDSIATTIQNKDIDIFEIVRGMLSFVPLDNRDTVRRQLIRSLDQNKEMLTDKPFVLKGEEAQPTISNWLADFRAQLGGEIVEDIKRVEYLANSVNARKLSDAERMAVQRLFDLYEYLKLSSIDQFGFEEMLLVEDEDGLKVFDSGFGYVLTDSKKPTRSEDTTAADSSAQPNSINDVQQEIIAAYQGDQRFEKKVQAEQAKLQKKFATDISGLRQIFFQAVQNNQQATVVAAFRVLAQERQLIGFLEQDAKLKDFLTVAWQKKYNEEVARDFKENPTSVRFVRLFIQYVLEDRLGMTEADAARQGAHLASIFVSSGKKEYNKVAYFDVAAKQFRWFS